MIVNDEAVYQIFERDIWSQDKIANAQIKALIETLSTRNTSVQR